MTRVESAQQNGGGCLETRFTLKWPVEGSGDSPTPGEPCRPKARGKGKRKGRLAQCQSEAPSSPSLVHREPAQGRGCGGEAGVGRGQEASATTWSGSTDLHKASFQPNPG